MLPPPGAEAECIAGAFELCDRAFHTLDESMIDHDDAREWVASLKALMNTDGLTDPYGQGLWRVKAAQLDGDEKVKLAQLVEDLANYFARPG